MNTRHINDPAFLSDNNQDCDDIYRTQTIWPYVLFCRSFAVGDNPDTLAGAQIIAVLSGSERTDINKLEKDPAFSASATHDNPPQVRRMYGRVFLGTDKDYSV